MADVNVKMGVSGIGEFKSAMREAQASVKTLDAELKTNEKQYRASGDAETYLTNRAKILQQQMAAQKNVIKQAESALQAMTKNGVNQASTAYQNMKTQLVNAKGALADIERQMNEQGAAADQAAGKTDKLVGAVNSINTKMNLETVTNGLKAIENTMVTVARGVADIAGQIWDSVTSAASWADDENTLAAMYGLDVETLQQMQYAARLIDTPVEAIIKAKKKLENNMVYGTDDVKDAFNALGVSIGTVSGKFGEVTQYRDWEDVFWETGEALKAMTDETMRDAMAQKVFGRSWDELMPLFNAGREEYQKTMESASTVSEENVNKLNELDDAVQKLNQEFEVLKNNFMAEMAPAFTVLADAASKLMAEFNAYLQTDEGQQKMQELNQALTELFGTLTDVDFGNVLDTAKNAIDKITDGLRWMKDNSEGIKTAIGVIAGAFAGIKVAESVLTLIALIKGVNLGGTLLGGAAGAAGAAGSAGAAAAAAGGGGIVSKIFGHGKKIVDAGTGTAPTVTNAAAGGSGAAAAAGGGFFSNMWQNIKGAGTAIAQGAKAVLPAVAETAALLTPVVLMVDGIRQDIENQQEGARVMAEYRERIDTQRATFGKIPPDMIITGDAKAYDRMEQIYQRYNARNNPMLETWNEFADAIYGTTNGGESGLFQRLMEGLHAISTGNDDPWFENLYDNLSDSMTDRMDELYKKWLTMPEESMTGDKIPLVWDIYEELSKQLEEGEPMGLKLDPEISFQELQQQFNNNPLTMSVRIQTNGLMLDYFNHTGIFGAGKANGISFVPFDGYPAILHKGERVVTARENANYTSNSNLYVQSMYMNNGIDAAALGAAMAAQSKRDRAGFGSR